MRCCEHVWLCMCGSVCVVLIIICPRCSLFCNIIIIIIIRTTHTLPHMHDHTCSQQRILLREINKQFDWHDWLTQDEPQTQEWTTYCLLSSLQKATPQLLPETPVFREFISHQSSLSRPALPKLRHLLTKLRQRKRSPLAIIRCFLDFSSPHTPAFTPGL